MNSRQAEEGMHPAPSTQHSALTRRVAATVSRQEMLTKGQLAVVAVSGGADSVCLLHILHQLGHALIVGHLHHGLRGPEADQDASFIQDLCDRLGLECVIERCDVLSYQRQRSLSLEAAGREVRYTFLRQLAKRRGAGAIFLGHTADDQIETFLMRLIRGAGLAGLGAMRPVSAGLCRPLLGIWKQEILSYLRTNGLTWREDSSNRDRRFLRNRVRHELLPLLANLNPGIRDVLLRECRHVNDRQKRIEAEVLRELGLSSRQIEQVLLGKDVILVGGRRLSITMNGRKAISAHPTSFDLPLHTPGKVSIPGVGTIEASVARTPAVVRQHSALSTQHSALLDATASTALRVRSRRPGDRFVPLGMADQKKLQDFLVDEKVARLERDRIPLVVSGDNIAWVAGLRIDDRFKVTPSTQRVLQLTFQRED